MVTYTFSFGAANLFSRFFPEFSDASFLRNCYWLRDIPLANQFIYCSSYFKSRTDWLDISAETLVGEVGGVFVRLFLRISRNEGPHSSFRIVLWPSRGICG